MLIFLLYICLCCISLANSSRQGIIESSIYDILQNIIQIKHIANDACNFVVLGDFSSRTGQQCDYVVDDHATHIDILPDDYVSDREIPSKSQDNIVNSNGQLTLKFLKQSGLRIANGRVCEAKQIGAYTFVGSRGSSLVD